MSFVLNENTSELELVTGRRIPVAAIESMTVRLLPIKSILLLGYLLMMVGCVVCGVFLHSSGQFADEAIKLNNILKGLGNPSNFGNPYTEQLINDADKIAANVDYFAKLSKKVEFQGLVAFMAIETIALLMLIGSYLKGSYGLQIRAMGAVTEVKCGSKSSAVDLDQKIINLKYARNSNSEGFKKAS